MRSEATAPLLVEGLSAEFWTEMGRLARRPFQRTRKGQRKSQCQRFFGISLFFNYMICFFLRTCSVRAVSADCIVVFVFWICLLTSLISFFEYVLGRPPI